MGKKYLLKLVFLLYLIIVSFFIPLSASRFGAMLDMLTDRCALMALVICCGCFYPDYLFYFQMSAVVDIASHWLHFHASDVTGKMTHKVSLEQQIQIWDLAYIEFKQRVGRGGTLNLWCQSSDLFIYKLNFFSFFFWKNSYLLLDKEKGRDRYRKCFIFCCLKTFHCINIGVRIKFYFQQSSNIVLHLYYTSRPFLFIMCLGNEAFYSLIYISHFWCGPGIHGFHLIPFLAALFFPVALLKSMISLLHLFIAAQTLVAKDRELIKQSKWKVLVLLEISC